MNNRIEFDYDKIKDGYKPVTRSGIYPTEVHRFETCTIGGPIIAIVKGQYKSYSDSGRWGYAGKDDHLDLFLEPPVRVEWWLVRVIPYANIAMKYDTLKNAMECKKINPVFNIVETTYQGDELISVELVK